VIIILNLIKGIFFYWTKFYLFWTGYILVRVVFKTVFLLACTTTEHWPVVKFLHFTGSLHLRCSFNMEMYMYTNGAGGGGERDVNFFCAVLCFIY